LRNTKVRTVALLAAIALASVSHAYVFTSISLPGSTSSTIVGVNNAGVAVGSAVGVAPADVAYSWDDGLFSSFAFNPGMGDVRTNYNGIADDGTTVGFYDVGSGTALVRTGFTRSSAGVVTALPFAPSSTNTTPLDRNRGGVTVGTVSPGTGASSANAFLYTGGSGFDLVYHHLGASRTQFNSVNNAGVIVGRWLDGSTTRGLVRSAAGVITSYDLPGATNTHLFGVNDVGQVVGYYTSTTFAGTRGFVLENLLDGVAGNETFADVIYPGTNASGTRVFAINDAGTLVGTYNGFTQGFVAIVPEPASAGLLGGGVALLAVRRRRSPHRS
jgi:hypothetical protein